MDLGYLCNIFLEYLCHTPVDTVRAFKSQPDVVEARHKRLRYAFFWHKKWYYSVILCVAKQIKIN